MDVVDFVREYCRMCDEYDACEGCPMDGKCRPCSEAVYKNPQVVVEIVEKWSKAHPIQTNRDKFFEVFGIDPRPAGYAKNHSRAEGLATEWWDRPYEEPKEGNE